MNEQNDWQADMTSTQLHNLNVEDHQVLISPLELKAELPLTEATAASVARGREEIARVIRGEDRRLLVVVGPCSIHDVAAAKDYADRLVALREAVKEELLVVMRVYFEKPRTTVGWKGLINDPYMDDSFRIEDGLRIARQLLLDLAAHDLPLATEALDPITPQYLQDLISWSAIGARTTESQTHREMASGLSSAVGFKNGTDGSLDSAINALQSVANPHRFLGIDGKGHVSVYHTRGNPNAHIVLRGGSNGPNYAAPDIQACEDMVEAQGLRPTIMVDCSHANSAKDHNRQKLVAMDVAEQIAAGNRSIIGLMLESNIKAGNQKISADLEYGVSVTDACIDWAETEALLRDLAGMLKGPLAARAA